MPDEQQFVTEYGPSHIISDWQTEPSDRPVNAGYNVEAAEALSREAVARDRALLAAMNRAPGTPASTREPVLREATLPSDFQSRLDALDDEIHNRGVAVDRDKLVSLGKKRFQELLAADRVCREEQRVIHIATDLTSWFSVKQSFAASGALKAPVPERSDSDRVSGSGKNRDAARAIAGFGSLWKCSQHEPRAVRAIYKFRDLFESLALAQSMLERTEKDSRVASGLFCFCAGRGPRVRYFADWLSVLQGSHFKVTIDKPLWHLIAWLANESAPAPETVDWARYWFGVRAPLPEQIKLSRAVCDGFVLGHSGWALWDFAGDRSRQLIDEGRLEAWRDELAKRYPRITAFHRNVSTAFCKSVRGAGYNYWRLDETAYRARVRSAVNKQLDRVAGLAALAIEETMPKTCVASFQDSVLCDGKPKKNVSDTIATKLNTAFPSANFQVVIEQLP